MTRTTLRTRGGKHSAAARLLRRVRGSRGLAAAQIRRCRADHAAGQITPAQLADDVSFWESVAGCELCTHQMCGWHYGRFYYGQ